jgi:hypothetical protein
MDNICGPPVRGEQFKYREKEVAEILNRLEVGESVLLIGLRRTGKSSVMLAVCDQAPKNWKIKYNDLQGMSNPSDFFKVLLQSLPKGNIEEIVAYWSKTKTIPNKLINFIKTNFTKLGGETASIEFQSSIIDYWHPLTEGIEHILKGIDKPIVFVLDEFPVFIEVMLKKNIPSNMIEEMLSQLKRWRLSYNNFRLLIGGSISFDRILSKNNISGSTISDLSRYFLPPLNRDNAKKFLQELSHSYKIKWYNEKLIEESLNLLEDYYPFFLQAFFKQVRERGISTKQSLQNIFEDHLIPYIRKGFFDQLLDRLRNHYTRQQQAIARDIFGFISRQEKLVANYSKLREIASERDRTGEVDLDEFLYDLTSDDFLFFDNRTNEYSFTIKLVARWSKITRGK